MKTRIFLFSACCLLSVMARAQSFYIYYVKGEVQVLEKKISRKAQAGDSVYNKTVVKIGAQATAGIVDSEGKAILLKVPGSYSYKAIADQLQAAKAVSSRYFSYVWKKFNDHHHPSPDQASMRAKGGISRSKRVPMHSPVDSANVMGLSVTFTWDNSEGNNYFTLLDENKNQLLKLSTRDSLVTLFPAYSNLQKGQRYFWMVSNEPYADPTMTFSFYLPDAAWIIEYQKEEQELRDLMKEIGGAELNSMLEEFRKIKKVYQ